MGVFAVNGNHDWWEDRAAMRAGRGAVPSIARAFEGCRDRGAEQPRCSAPGRCWSAASIPPGPSASSVAPTTCRA